MDDIHLTLLLPHLPSHLPRAGGDTAAPAAKRQVPVPHGRLEPNGTVKVGAETMPPVDGSQCQRHLHVVGREERKGTAINKIQNSMINMEHKMFRNWFQIPPLPHQNICESQESKMRFSHKLCFLHDSYHCVAVGYKLRIFQIFKCNNSLLTSEIEYPSLLKNAEIEYPGWVGHGYSTPSICCYYYYYYYYYYNAI
jgi:hypothetical protein